MRRRFGKAQRWLILVGLAAALLIPELAAAQLPAGLRGLWVPRWGLTDPGWVGRMVDDAAQAGFNALFVQVDGRGEAYYRSELLPPADGLGDYDALADILARAHAKGLAVHAWINAFTVGLPGRRPSSARHVLNAHPDWVTCDAAGESLLAWTPARAQRNLVGYFLDPGLPEVQDFVTAVVEEVARRYPVDGIHLDYIRYPGPNLGYHPAVRQAFLARYGVDPLKLEADSPLRSTWDDWRRAQVSQVVRRVSAAARLARPGVLVSAAVFPSLHEAWQQRFQDWPRWVLEGDLDFVAPMAYSASTPEVEAWLAAGWQAAPVAAVFPGLGAYKFGSDGAAFVTQLEAVLARRPSGVMVYSYQALQQMPGILALLSSGPFASPASAAPPAPPTPVAAPPPVEAPAAAE